MKHETYDTADGKQSFHYKLRSKIDEYIHLVYKATRNFPKEELYGVVSQLRRAVISIMLNYVEGYARNRGKVHKNFLEISYGSLKESMYLLEFCLKENYLNQQDYDRISIIGNEIGAMIWGILRKL